VLPHAWWPADRQAPGELEFVRRFLNSVNRENGAERFGSAAGLDRWLASEGAPSVAASERELARLLAVREALHRLVVANAGATGDGEQGAWDELVTATGGVSFGVVRDRSGLGLSTEPVGTHVERLVGRIVSAVITAQRDRTWPRLKACRHCRWVVFDPSKNRSARWCSMSACGGRHNAREYRRRSRSAS
jgi:predicted RNA-binding Zn ribbon-like protein